jgi:predicted nuclease with TOPRIM domain
VLLFVLVGFIAFYYFNKFQESEREYIKLHSSLKDMYNENQNMKLKVKELQAYKDDVSKTFKILDNELVMINNHLQRRQQPSLQQPSLQQQPLQQASSRVSLLTPELLNTVFFDITPQRLFRPQSSTSTNINTIVENIPVVSMDMGLQETLNGISEVKTNTEDEDNNNGNGNDMTENKDIMNESGSIGRSLEEEEKSLEEKLDEQALEKMLKNVEMSTMNDLMGVNMASNSELMGEVNEYNKLLLDLNKFKLNN